MSSTDPSPPHTTQQAPSSSDTAANTSAPASPAPPPTQKKKKRTGHTPPKDPLMHVPNNIFYDPAVPAMQDLMRHNANSLPRIESGRAKEAFRIKKETLARRRKAARARRELKIEQRKAEIVKSTRCGLGSAGRKMNK